MPTNKALAPNPEYLNVDRDTIPRGAPGANIKLDEHQHARNVTVCEFQVLLLCDQLIAVYCHRKLHRV